MDAPDYKDHEDEECIQSMPSNGKHQNTLVKHMDIVVSESERRLNGPLNLRDYYVVYLIETKVNDASFTGSLHPACTLWRRYSEFELLKTYLEVVYSYVIVPPLPEKRSSLSWQKPPTSQTPEKCDADFIERRRIALEGFLVRVAEHPAICYDPIFIKFLQLEEGWKEAVNATGYWNKIDSILKTMSASYRLRKPDKKFDELKSYSNELQGNLSQLLRARASVAEKIYAIHKLHGNYGRIFSEWSSIENNLGDALQLAGHYMDDYSSWIDGLLEEEEQYADQLKEYLFYGESLRMMSRKADVLQLKVESQETSLESKAKEKERVQQGKSGLLFRLLGSVDTDEMREFKSQQLTEQIHDTEIQLQTSQQELSDFSEKAAFELDRWKEQKVKDINNTFYNYCRLQINLCKKGLTTWKNVRDTLNNA